MTRRSRDKNNGAAILLTGGAEGTKIYNNTVSSSSLSTIGAHEYQTDALVDSDGDEMGDLWESGYGLI